MSHSFRCKDLALRKMSNMMHLECSVLFEFLLTRVTNSKVKTKQKKYKRQLWVLTRFSICVERVKRGEDVGEVGYES